MRSNNLHYQESGNYNTLGLIGAFVVILFIAAGLGYFYSLFIYFIPIIYFNVLITVALGIAIGLISRLLFRLTHNRNKMSRYALTILFGLLVYYFHWVAYILLAYQEGYVSFGEYIPKLNLILSPSWFFGVISEINTIGLWAMFGGFVVNGIVLTIVWIIEAAIIFGASILLVSKSNLEPYSELNKKWYPKFTLNTDFESIPSVNSFLPKLEKSPVEAIKSLEKSAILRIGKVHVYYIKGEMHQYLTLENIYLDDKGKKETELIIENFRIDEITARQMLDEFNHKRNRYRFYYF